MDIGGELIKLALSALFGFGGGLVAERSRSFLRSVDDEADRLDLLVDDAAQRAVLLIAGVRCPQEALVELTNRRSRLGQNLRRIFGKSRHYPALAAQLGLLAATIGGLDPPVGGASSALADEIRDRGEALRRNILKAAADDWSWKLLRGRRT